MTWFKTYQKYVFFVVIVGWGTATNLNKNKKQKLFQLWYCFLSWQIFDFPGPAEEDDQRGGRLDLTRDGQAGGVLHQKEGHQVGCVQGGGLWGEEGEGWYQIVNQQRLQLWSVKLDSEIVNQINNQNHFLIYLLKIYISWICLF